MNNTQLTNRIKTLNRAIEDSPGDVALLIELGRCHSSLGAQGIHQAVRTLEQATKIDPYNAQASFELGINYTRLKSFDSAIREWENMVDTDGDMDLDSLDYTRFGPINEAFREWKGFFQSRERSIFNLYYVAIAAMVLGRHQDALRAFEEVEKINPSFERTLLYRGRLYHRLSNRTDLSTEFDHAKCRKNALDDLTRYLEYRPRDPHAAFFLGLCLLDEGRTQQALNCFKKCFVDRPQHMKGHLHAAAAYMNLMQFDEALDHLHKALKVDPRSAKAHHKVGRCYEKKYMMDEAIAAYEKAIELKPNYKDAHFAMGALCRTMGLHDQAILHLRKTVELDPNESEAYYIMGIVLVALKRYQEAVEPLREAVKLAPNNAFAHYTLGKACLGSEQLEPALACFRQALELNPRDTKARTALGQVFFQMSELTRAKRQFEKVLEENPREAEAHYFLGACQFRLHEYGGAIVSYQNAASVAEGSALFSFTQGAIRSYQRRYDEAIKYFQEATQFRPDTEADLGMFSTLQLLATVGIDHAQTGMVLQKFAKQRDELFKIFVMALASFLDARDRYTRYHSRRVAQIGTLLATSGLKKLVQAGDLGPEFILPEDMVTGITVGGLLHDIGKIGIRDSVLNKPGKLTDEEYELIKQHPVIGAEGLRKVPFPWPEVLPIVRHHHEKWNGHGYPDKLGGDDIPFEAQIIGVADFYDALTTNRPYRKAFTPGQALNIMKEESGKFFNPRLIEAFEAIIDDVILVPEAPVDETGQYVLGDMEDDGFDSLSMSWSFGSQATLVQ